MINRLKALFYNLPMMGKLLILLILCSLLPLMVISVYSFTSAKNQLLEQAYDNMNHMNQQINNNISSQLDSFHQISGMLYTNATLKAYLTREYNQDIDFVEAYSYINDLFFGLMAANSNVDGITVYVFNNTIPTDGVFVKYLFDTKASPEWVRKLDQSYGNVVYTGITLNDRKERVFSLARIMNFSSLNYPYGVLTISVKEDYLYSMIRQESEGKSIYVVDEKGDILSTRDKNLISGKLSEVLGVEIPMEDAAGRLVMDIQGKRSLVVFNRMDQGWRTVSIVPVNDILRETRRSASRILMMAGLSFLLALILIVFISKYLTGRIRNLTGQVALIEREDFSGKIEIKGNDEIGQLSHAFNRMTDQLNRLINELYKQEITRRDAELYALQSQINPHFLYNTLSVISSLAIRKGDGEISGIINHLSAFYKTSLNKGMRYITVGNELDITRHYLAIQHMRFRDHFRESYEVDETLFPCRTLKLVLQPFIENAINHAVCEREEPLHIIIRVFCEENRICYEVEDDGAGIEEEKMERLVTGQPEAGYGIYNVNERIQLAYGRDYGVSIRSFLGKGTKVKITIPL